MTFEAFALESETVTPPAGAGVGRVTAKGADWPGARITFEGRPMMPPLVAGVLVSEKGAGEATPVTVALTV